MDVKIYSQSEKEKMIGHFFHFYQPERRGQIGPSIRLPELGAGVHFRLLSEVNYKIAMESYLPVFLRADMDRVLRQSNITFFPSLRYWFEKAYPAGELSGWSSFFTLLMVKIRSLQDRAYHVLSGPPVHIILPLLPDADIATILELTREIDFEDFGFTPKGLFCPEMAVDSRVINIASRIGFEYVALRDFQVSFDDKSRQQADGSVSPQNCVCAISFPDGSCINAILADSALSGQIAFNRQATINADSFLEDLSHQPHKNKISAIDGETIGHHVRYLDLFFARMHDVLESRGFVPMEVKRLLAEPQKPKAEIRASSWSCSHGFGRWTGDCDCDNPSPEVRHNKKVFLSKLRYYNVKINSDLDKIQPDWRIDFKREFKKLRKKILTGANYVPDLEEAFSDQNYLRLMTAKFALIIGFTSCGTFFAHKNQVEKRIPQAAIQTLELLFSNLKKDFLNSYPDMLEKDEQTGQTLPDITRYEFVDV